MRKQTGALRRERERSRIGPGSSMSRRPGQMSPLRWRPDAWVKGHPSDWPSGNVGPGVPVGPSRFGGPLRWTPREKSLRWPSRERPGSAVRLERRRSLRAHATSQPVLPVLAPVSQEPVRRQPLRGGLETHAPKGARSRRTPDRHPQPRMEAGRPFDLEQQGFKAQGRIERTSAGTRAPATDSTAEQGPEVGRR